MVVKISKNLEKKSLLPAPRSPLPAHVLAFPAKKSWLNWNEGGGPTFYFPIKGASFAYPLLKWPLS
jgi:hypothetical protein